MTFHYSKRASSKSSFKVAKIVEAKSIEIEYAGDIVGTGTWTFEPTDGKTKVQVRFNARTNRLLMSLFSPFVNFEKRHSDTMQKGFKALNSYLSKK
jgi:cytochrome c oxidase assembly protein Cox11